MSNEAEDHITYTPEVGASETLFTVVRQRVGSWDGLFVMIGWWPEEALDRCINRVEEPAKDMRGGHPMPETVSNQLAR